MEMPKPFRQYFFSTLEVLIDYLKTMQKASCFFQQCQLSLTLQKLTLYCLGEKKQTNHKIYSKITVKKYDFNRWSHENAFGRFNIKSLDTARTGGLHFNVIIRKGKWLLPMKCRILLKQKLILADRLVVLIAECRDWQKVGLL